MNKKILLSLFTSIYLISTPIFVFGSVMENEIDHLLSFVENTECHYERNGKFYLILCEGSQNIKSSEWLHKELKKYRVKNFNN